jgi:hypothetical protein
VKPESRPTEIFMNLKRAEVGDDNYYKALSGEISMHQALGPNWNPRTDPHAIHLNHTPRSDEEKGFPVSIFFYCLYC